jgi:hypothetical protein
VFILANLREWVTAPETVVKFLHYPSVWFDGRPIFSFALLTKLLCRLSRLFMYRLLPPVPANDTFGAGTTGRITLT